MFKNTRRHWDGISPLLEASVYSQNTHINSVLQKFNISAIDKLLGIRININERTGTIAKVETGTGRVIVLFGDTGTREYRTYAELARSATRI